jgi:hypothetical protein
MMWRRVHKYPLLLFVEDAATFVVTAISAQVAVRAIPPAQVVLVFEDHSSATLAAIDANLRAKRNTCDKHYCLLKTQIRLRHNGSIHLISVAESFSPSRVWKPLAGIGYGFFGEHPKHETDADQCSGFGSPSP